MLDDEAYRKRMEEIHKEISQLNGLKTAVNTIMKVAEHAKR